MDLDLLVELGVAGVLLVVGGLLLVVEGLVQSFEVPSNLSVQALVLE